MIGHASRALAFAGLLLAAPAAAQEACTSVECHVDRGLAARAQQRDADAVESFRAAYTMAPTAYTLAQLALAEQAVGRWVDAHAHLVDALGRDDPWIAGHREVLESALSTIRARLGRLVVTADVEGVELTVNGTAAGALPMSDPLWLEAGTAVIEVSAEGYEPVRRRPEIVAGQLSRVHVELLPTTAPPPRDELAAAAPSGPPVLLTVGGIAAGLSLLALAGTITAAVIRNDHVLIWNDPARCPPFPDGRAGACPDVYSTWTTAEHWTIAGAITSGVLAGLGAAFLALAAAEGGPDGTRVELEIDPQQVALRLCSTF